MTIPYLWRAALPVALIIPVFAIVGVLNILEHDGLVWIGAAQVATAAIMISLRDTRREMSTLLHPAVRLHPDTIELRDTGRSWPRQTTVFAWAGDTLTVTDGEATAELKPHLWRVHGRGRASPEQIDAALSGMGLQVADDGPAVPAHAPAR